jgi:hypothetical protein
MSDIRKRAIRKLMAETGLKYTQAMRLHDEQHANTASENSGLEAPDPRG